MDRMSFLARIAAFFALVALSTQCKRPQTTSGLQHEFGNTSVPPLTNLFDCHQTPSFSAGQDDTNFPLATAYIKQVAAHVMANNGATFSGPYAADRFCFHIKYDESFNAFAMPGYREVTFHTGAFGTFGNDAEVAAVMAHELAHITMQHQSNLTHADFQKLAAQMPAASGQQGQVANSQHEVNQLAHQYDTLAKEVYQIMESMKSQDDAKDVILEIQSLEATIAQNRELQVVVPDRWQDLADRLAAAYDSLTGVFDAENGVAVVAKWRELARLEASMNQKGQELMQAQGQLGQSASQVISPEQTSNGTEREADEVGYELYLRAKMVPQNYTSMIGNLVQMENEGVLSGNSAFFECLKQMALALRVTPERGYASHPTGCWRLFNIAGSESQTHAEDYKDLIPAAVLTSISGQVTLAQVQEEIRNYVPQQPGALPDDYLKAREELCRKLGGFWTRESNYCHLEITQAERKTHCENSGFGFWHDVCQCLPLDWKDEEIDENRCVPKSFPEFPPGPSGPGGAGGGSAIINGDSTLEDGANTNEDPFTDEGEEGHLGWF